MHMEAMQKAKGPGGGGGGRGVLPYKRLMGMFRATEWGHIFMTGVTIIMGCIFSSVTRIGLQVFGSFG